MCRHGRGWRAQCKVGVWPTPAWKVGFCMDAATANCVTTAGHWDMADTRFHAWPRCKPCRCAGAAVSPQQEESRGSARTKSPLPGGRRHSLAQSAHAKKSYVSRLHTWMDHPRFISCFPLHQHPTACHAPSARPERASTHAKRPWVRTSPKSCTTQGRFSCFPLHQHPGVNGERARGWLSYCVHPRSLAWAPSRAQQP